MGDLNSVLDDVKQTAQNAPAAPVVAPSETTPDVPGFQDTMKGLQSPQAAPVSNGSPSEEDAIMRSMQQKRQAALLGDNSKQLEDLKGLYQGQSVNRIAEAFGHGTLEAANAALSAPPQTTKQEIENAAPVKGENAWMDAMNQYVVRPAIYGIAGFKATAEAALGVASAPFEGAAQALEQMSKETGSQIPADLAGALRDPAMMMILHQAQLPTPNGIHDLLTKPPLPAEVYRAVDNGIVEPTDPAIKEEAAQYSQASTIAFQEAQEALPKSVATNTPTTVHDIARQDNPQLFAEYDPANTRRTFYGNLLRDLAQKRDEVADAQPRPHADEIQDISDGINKILAPVRGVEDRLTKTKANQLDELRKRQAVLQEDSERQVQENKANLPDTAEMASVREAWYREDAVAGRLAPQVQKALSDASAKVPAPVEAVSAPTESGFQPTEGHYGEFQESGTPENPVAETPPEATDRIADTISKNLQEAGRPKEEADSAAQIASSFYKTLADVYGGRHGTAEDWFAREGAAVKAGGEGKTVRGAYKAATDAAKATIRLMKSANASTFIHETGHHFLAVMDRLSKETDAPQGLKDDSATIRKWLGIDENADLFEKNAKGKYVYEKQQEQFAKGFENYVREGVAPSRALAGVFAKFKTWLGNIYKAAQKLKTPINADVRGVFDRMLATNPEKTTIAPERTAEKLSDIHEKEAANTPPEKADAARDAIEKEVDLTAQKDPEVADAIKAAETANVPETAAGDTTTAETTQPSGENVTPGGSGEVPGGSGESGGESGDVGKPTGDRTAGGEPAKPVREKSVPAEKLFDGEVKAGNLRLENLTNDETIRAALRMLAEKTKLLDHAVVSDLQVAEFARALGKKGSGGIMEKLDHMAAEDGVPLAAYVRAAVEMLGKAEDSAREFAAKVEGGTDADFQNALEAQDRFMMLAATVSETGNELGRAMRAFQETSSVRGSAAELQELFQRVGSSVEERKQLFKLIANKPKGKSAKVMQAAVKPGYWDTFAEFRRCEILSGWITHSLWLAGTGINIAYKAGVIDTLGGLHNEIGKMMGRPDTGSRIFGGMEGLARTITKALPNILSATGTAARTGKTVLRPFEGKNDTYLATGGIKKVVNVNHAELAKAVDQAFNENDHDDLKALREKLDAATAQGNTERAEVIQEALDKKTAKRKADITQVIAAKMQSRLKTWGDLTGEISDFASSTMAAIEAVGKNMFSPEFYKDKPALEFDRSEGSMPNIKVKGVPVLPIGGVMRGTSNRIYSTMHTFTREIAANIESVQEARRMAIEEGSKGADIETRKNDLLEEPTREFMQRVNLIANEQTLMSNESSFAKVITNFRNKIDSWSGMRLGSIVAPVVGVPAEATKQTVVDNSLFGLFSERKRAALMGESKPLIDTKNLTDEAKAQAEKQNAVTERTNALAQERAQVRMFAGTALFGLGYWLADGGMTTPSPSINYKQEEERRDAGEQSGSARIGDWMVDLRHLPITGTILTLGADLHHIKDVAMGVDESDRLKPAVASAINNFFMHENSLVEMSNIIDAMALKTDPMTYLKNQGDSLVPQFIKQTNDLIDPTQRDSKNFLNSLLSKIPGESQDVPAKINSLTGEPLQREPFHTHTAIGDPIAQNLMSLHIFPANPRPTINGVELDPQQNAEYASTQGHILYSGLQMLMQGEGTQDYNEADTDGKRKMIQRIQRHAGNCAKSMMFSKYPELLKDANDKYESECIQEAQ